MPGDGMISVEEARERILALIPRLQPEKKPLRDAQGQVLVRCRRSSDEGQGALVVTGHGPETEIGWEKQRNQFVRA